MKKKTVIVIGGSKGLGKAICKKFLENEYQVINGSRSQPKINHKNFYSIKLDVKKEKNFVSFYNKVKNISNNIDVLINNTGLSEWKSLEKISNNFLYKIYETNVFYIFWSCKHALKLLKKNTSIINVSSIAGKRGSKNNSVYSSSKFAVNGITQSLAKELGNRSIRVNAICPVLIKTKGLIAALKKNDSPAFNMGVNKFLGEFTKNNSATGKLPTEQDVTDLIMYLASDKNPSLTGQCINIDSGVFPQ